ncbi:MAG: hypothetical protein J6Q54_05540 [Oscillospiraceae bacterium]|nr:hypothetical protein [Oscillospiraceae bacterium]
MAKKDDFQDDGRTIAPMDDVYRPSPFLGRSPMIPRTRDEQRKQDPNKEGEIPEFSKEERSAAVWGAMKAALLIGGAFILGLGLIILLMDILL